MKPLLVKRCFQYRRSCPGESALRGPPGDFRQNRRHCKKDDGQGGPGRRDRNQGGYPRLPDMRQNQHRPESCQRQKGYSDSRYTSAFAGFAPFDNPALAILVVVDEPKQNHYGGIVAAPAFKDIMARSFNYLNIAPNTDMIAALPREVSHAVD